MEGFKRIEKTREYLDYLERHLENIEKAWQEIRGKCKNQPFIYDDFRFFELDQMVKKHDLSKFGPYEFTQYRDHFFPIDPESKKPLDKAWDHHKAKNDHHWQNWTKSEFVPHPYYQELCCVHMVIDWMAMGYEFGDTAREYYEANKEKIDLPKWAVAFIYEIFDRVYENKR